MLLSNDLGAERALWIRLYSKRTTSRNLPQLRRKPAGRPCRTGFSLSCLLHHTLPSPNAIAKPPASGPPKIVGADTFFASRRGASSPKRVLLLQ